MTDLVQQGQVAVGAGGGRQVGRVIIGQPDIAAPAIVALGIVGIAGAEALIVGAETDLAARTVIADLDEGQPGRG